jgi:D-beta-D-heptose 7-phosphate kinase/D-beta-D-heptose 1-phosphate adenosyltransferase
MIENKRKIVAISGGMDCLHSGHVAMILDAATYGDVVVILNSDDWLLRKKGYKFMDWNERAEILSAIRGVVEVVPVDDSDGTVCEALRRIRPDYFANGGDRKAGNTPEGEVCKELGIEMLWNIGGGKTQSSSWLIDAVRAPEGKKV